MLGGTSLCKRPCWAAHPCVDHVCDYFPHSSSWLESNFYLNPAFNGQLFGFSSVSSVTGGKQMIPILNTLKVNIAVFGNHDFGKF